MCFDIVTMSKASTEFKKEHKQDFGHEKIEVLYEDEDICIVSKPSGMLSVPYPGSHNKTAQDALEQIMRKKGTFSSGHRPFVVHRLDRDTSGVMMFALTAEAQKKIMDNWQTMVTERLYHAVAENPKAGFLPDFGVIDDELAYNAHNVGFVPKKGDRPSDSMATKKAMQSKRNAGGGEKSIYERNLTVKNGHAEFKTITAKTHFRVVARGKTHTLFELSLDTGRKNQIRAHLAHKGYPLCGDENYRAKTDPFGRLALHARTLEFNHPYTGQHMKFEVPEPEEWLETVQNDSGNVPAVWAAPAPRGNGKNRGKPAKQKDIYEEISSHKGPSRKKMAGMDFISRGKLHR